MWGLTALSKLSIRIGQSNPIILDRIKQLIGGFNNHMNVEIQQRACEFLIILSDNWSSERNGIFEPMPFKGDENMTFDAHDRAALDADEGDG